MLLQDANPGPCLGPSGCPYAVEDKKPIQKTTEKKTEDWIVYKKATGIFLVLLV